MESSDLLEILNHQKSEANHMFSKFISSKYEDLVNGNSPLVMSHQMIEKLVLDKLSKDTTTLLVVIDNLRLDQWRVLQTYLSPFYKLQDEQICSSILPTATQYARNALFAGELPVNIKRLYPDFWKDDTDAGGKTFLKKSFWQLNFLL